MQLGNGRWESTTFNSRLQPTQIALGQTQAATNLLKLDYGYGTTANNGNVLSQTITVPSVGAATGFVAVQSYNYDSLNRLKDATENVTPTGGSSSQSWKQTFTFDRYGNRRFDEANTTMPASFANQAATNPTISTSNNRLTSTGWTYDASGNTTGDPEGRSFTYDAENKQVEVKNSSNASVGQYFYDGDGKRVKKVVPGTGEITVFVYDAAGKQIAEYSTIVASVEDAKVAYLTNDHLGSPRINTDANGAVIARHDYHPFGEEIATSQRTSDIGYTDDTVRKQFTGYERDIESELDFAQARMYNPKHGRFTSVDPLMASADILNPQTFNRYVYVGNNPVNMNDPTGEIWGQSGNSLQWFDTEDAMKKAGFSAYDGPMIGMRGDQMYALSATTGAAVAVNSASQLLGQLAAWGATSAAIESAALTLGVAAPLALAYVAAVKYSPGQVDATMDDCMSCGRMIQNHVNMMNQKADELAAKVNAEARANSQSSPADPNDPNNNKPNTSVNKGGARKLGNLASKADSTARDVLRQRGGNASATRQGNVPQEYWNMKLGDLANKAAAGDRKADTVIKLVKQATKKAGKY